ncbi:dsRBD fold-containing protein [Puerhibacterium sp. TATVAM-FAB25]|uniref:dsRBD fold-containing protein n=1 Tax=Puerhibacterium sp. TATVAM-FAB25 TaxID=3093699 RepID=UPI00397CDD93
MAHTWTVTIQLFDADDIDPEGTTTSAHALLRTSSGTSLEGRGTSRRNPHDPPVREIGEELAAARALRHLADRLLEAASDDLAPLEPPR